MACSARASSGTDAPAFFDFVFAEVVFAEVVFAEVVFKEVVFKDLAIRGLCRASGLSEKPLCRRARFVRHLRARQHARDLLLAGRCVEPGDLRGDATALVARAFRDVEMVARAGRDLRRMGHRQHLHVISKSRQTLADRIRDRAADARVDLVEHEGRRRPAIRQRHLEGQHEAREFTARSDFHQGTGPRARVGLDPELHAVEAVRPVILRIAIDSRGEARPFELQRREFPANSRVEPLRCGHAPR